MFLTSIINQSTSFYTQLEDETRAEKFGRSLANQTRAVLNSYPRKQALDYVDILMMKVSNYSFKKRKEGEPVHEGCKWSLSNLERTDIYNPEEEALFVKEAFDMTYNKDRARAMFLSFMDAMENLREDVVEDTL